MRPLLRPALLYLGLAITLPATALAGDALTPEQALGQLLYEDVNLSLRRNQTRNTKPEVCTDNTDPRFARTCWPAPEIGANVNTEELGNLKLSAQEEEALVAFMKTLTDGYPDWGNDPGVPPGTPSPFATTPLPPAP